MAARDRRTMPDRQSPIRAPAEEPFRLAFLRSILALRENRRQKRNRDLGMARNRVTASARLCMRALDDIYARTVMLQKIEIHSREVRQRITEISHQRNRFQEHFRHHDRGTE